jgi:flagellum-specific peptidoglycan hydrolase FlgJ
MIRLKKLLTESADNSPKVLFVGDKQILSRGSFAQQLINSNVVSGKIVGRNTVNSVDLFKLLRKNINKSYNIVVIMVGPDQMAGTDKLISNSLKLLNASIKYAKSFDASVILISAPATTSKNKLDFDTIQRINKQIESNTTADNVIDISDSNVSSKSGILDSAVQMTILDSISAFISTIPKSDTKSVEPGETTPADAESPAAPAGASDEDLVDLGPAPANASAFISMWKDTAIDEMNKTGIPASITLAQAGLESAWGKSRLARKGNNFFGIKCHGWTGDTIRANDDRPNECFRKYTDAAESFKDHSSFLVKNGRYSKLFNLPPSDFKGWADGLQTAGYATSSTYANKLISIIQSYGLDKYDTKLSV